MRLLPVLFLAFLLGSPHLLLSQILTKNLGELNHPRIMLFEEDERVISKMVEDHYQWEKIHETILQESEAILSLPPVERIQIGRRLLDKSREALRRIFHLSYAFRMTGEEKFLKRAEKELLAVSHFSDWNPSH